ncbi:cell division protein FtsQ/DivIB [Uruburuella testudinis]|uniref:Cell division protein FtsQ n=1 Tax=Uruburuella testudinis TaxID=1282863 RepID=A0ABY4DVV8_9NEIS|nr:cell division protein FtsQ/DivIB [Uruburuella testudinis]UOO82179.1 cell division protein FtsQ/DivIB [Uruburuella testudinis]
MWDNAGAMRRITRWLFTLVLLLLLGAGAVWLYHSPHFPIKQVRIEGDLQRVSSSQLQTVAQKYIRGNIFSADLNGAQQAFEKLPWIAKAQVRRRLPDVVEIHLVERIPVARWQGAGLVDSDGRVFQAATDETFPEFDGQPGTGATMVAHYAEFSRILEPQGLAIAKLEYTPRSAWSVVLTNGVNVRLGREQETPRLQRFAAVWPGILRAQQGNLDYVDMRYKDGFAVRHRNRDEETGATAQAEASGAAAENQQ